MDINIYYQNILQGTVTYSHPTASTANQKIDIDLWSKVGAHIRCYVKYSNGNFNFCPYATYKARKIVILLESPHKNEFDQNFNPLVPLNGRSGKKFDNKIISQLQKWFNGIYISENSIFEIMLLNPVPYQTSLYHFISNKIPYQPLVGASSTIPVFKIDKKVRDKVWRLLFPLPCCENEMIIFLKNYNPDYIINCCTGKSTKYNTFGSLSKVRKTRNITSLKIITRISIFTNNLINNNYLEDAHPVSW